MHDTNRLRWEFALPVILLIMISSRSVCAAVSVEAARIDGTLFRGELLACFPDVRIRTADSDVSMAWADLMHLRNTGGPSITAQPAPGAGRLRFVLSDGSAFDGVVVAEGEKDFEVEIGSYGRFRLDFSVVSSIRTADASPAALERLETLAADGERTSDIAVIARGEQVLVLTGVARSAAPDRLRFEWNEKVNEIAWNRVAGLLLARTTPRSAACRLTTTEGEVFAGRVSGGDSESLVLQSGILDRITFAWSRIARVDCRSDRYVFLSDVRPQTYRAESFFDRDWPLGLDASLLRQPITLGGRQYAKGLVMHSRSEVMYRFDTPFSQFAATVGISDEMRESGCVTMRVLGDGRVLWEAEQVRGGDVPREVLVPLRGVRELTLQVDFDDDLDLGDHAVWAFARLLR